MRTLNTREKSMLLAMADCRWLVTPPSEDALYWVAQRDNDRLVADSLQGLFDMALHAERKHDDEDLG